MTDPTERYRRTLEVSRAVAWTIRDVLPDGARLDVERPFLPHALARTADLACLTPREQHALNHVRGHSYLALFGIVEEFILPFVLDHARARLGADDWEVRALLAFAAEEAKHIHLFRRFEARFAEDVGARCRVIGPPEAIAQAVLEHHPIGVGLAILHIEWMTQRHYVEAIRDDAALDPLFSSLLRHHWLEEAQHAVLDGLIVDGMAARMRPAEVRAGIVDYHRIVQLLDDGLGQQVEHDLLALQELTGRELRAGHREEVRQAQRASYRFTFLESGATHPRFRQALAALQAR